jgi:hypothetical protein
MLYVCQEEGKSIDLPRWTISATFSDSFINLSNFPFSYGLLLLSQTGENFSKLYHVKLLQCLKLFSIPTRCMTLSKYWLID